MSEEIKKEEQNAQKDNLAEERVLLSEFKKLQESTVSKEKYEADINALKEKNQLYLKAITEGSKVDDVPQGDEKDLKEMIADLSTFKGTNLDYWRQTTRAIDKTISALGENEISKMITGQGLETLVKVKTVMSKMVEDSNGDPDYFRSLYKARIIDSAPTISSEIEKAGGLVEYLYSNSRNSKRK